MQELSPVHKQELLDYLTQFMSDNKKEIFHPILSNRTKHLTVVLENVYQAQNASAIVRSCDCFGVQDLHVIETLNDYEVNPLIAMGSSKWVDIHKYPDTGSGTQDCFKALKQKGYKIVATSPSPDGVSLHDLPLDEKTALCFGTELSGLSEEALELADVHMNIPMYGFTESFNISVSVAICLSHIITYLHQSQIDWKLSDEERLDILLDWSRKALSRGDEIQEEFMKKHHLL